MALLLHQLTLCARVPADWCDAADGTWRAAQMRMAPHPAAELPGSVHSRQIAAAQRTAAAMSPVRMSTRGTGPRVGVCAPEYRLRYGMSSLARARKALATKGTSYWVMALFCTGTGSAADSIRCRLSAGPHRLRTALTGVDSCCNDQPRGSHMRTKEFAKRAVWAART